jgi:RHS repeat-associated protein
LFKIEPTQNHNHGALTEQTCYNVRLQPVVVRMGTGTVNCQSPATPSTDVLNLAYNYGTTNNNGNLLSQTITRSGVGLSQSYGYDSINRLLSASEGSNWTQTYLYDGYGNRAVQPASWIPNPFATPTAKTQFTNNRWSGSTSGVASYDNAGNQTGLPSRSFWYDSENRMVGASGPNIGWTGYAYDGEGRRVMKWVCPAGQCASSLNGANVTVYVYDAHGKLAAEYGPQADVGTRYLMADHLGSTRAVVDGAGGVQQCNDFYPFGEDIPQGMGGRGSCFSNGNYPEAGPDKANQKFTGKERDWETGLDYFGARYFSGVEGRFASADPKILTARHLTSPQKWNKYAYVLNNPLNRIDPDGQDDLLGIATKVGAWIGAGVAAQGGKQFAKDVAIGAAKGAGSFVANNAKAIAAGSQAAGGNPAGAVATLMAPGPRILQPSNQTQAVASTATQITLTAATMLAPAVSAAAGADAAAGAARGLSEFGGIFSSQPTAAGGQLYTSTGLISQGDVAGIVNSAGYAGGDINILSGVHGLPDGTVTPQVGFYNADMATFGNLPNVNVYDFMSMTDAQVTSVVNGPGTTIGGFCNSCAVLAPYVRGH